MNVVDKVPNLLGFTPEQLTDHLTARGVDVPLDEARRVLAHAISLRPDSTERRRPVRASVLKAVADHTRLERLEVVERVTDPVDNFCKYLLRSPDGALTEAVRIPLHKEGCFTVCLSSQVGCAMGCAFCATGRLGLTRNLQAWEMVSAFKAVRDEAPGRVTGAVFMGQGEPFHNYDEVIQAARVLSNPCGGRIRMENITISTVGLVPQIRRYTREGHRFRLIVSLTSAVAERRRTLLPVAGRFPLTEVADAIREYALSRGERATVAWVVMGGLNTGDDEVAELKRLLSDVPLRINLIDVNESRPDGFVRASDEELSAFRDRLQVLGVPVVRRYSGGRERHAACGMLAATRFGEANSTART
ncbi:MAG: radical SAM protein [Myxococcota bacterium]